MFKRNWHKYNAVITEVNWKKFRSKLEARIFKYLIDNWYNIVWYEPVFLLQDSFEYDWYKYRKIIYKSDFFIQIKEKKILIEVKWMLTDVYKIKKKLFLYKINEFKKEFWDFIFIEVKSIKQLKELLFLIENN